MRKELEGEFDSVYLTTLHRFIIDVTVDGDVKGQLFLPEEAPFRECKTGGFRHGAEYTIDNSSIGQLLVPVEEESDFSRLPYGNFKEFLAKTDIAYYGRHNMRWAHYSARDHQPGRPYVTVGTRFFARLVQNLVELSNQQWTWDEKLTRRWHERRRLIIGDLVRTHVLQSFTENPQLPEMFSVDDMMASFRSMKSSRTDKYDRLHRRWTYGTGTEDSDERHNARPIQ